MLLAQTLGTTEFLTIIPLPLSILVAVVVSLLTAPPAAKLVGFSFAQISGCDGAATTSRSWAHFAP